MENEEPIVKKDKPKPLINDAYWFGIAKDLIDKAPDNINASADKFKDLILWLWGIYTPIIGIGSTALSLFSKTEYSAAAVILLVFPSIVLLFAYWAATRAATSANVKFEPRSPEDIERAFYEGLREKSKFYRLSQILAGVSCALIPIAIMTASISKKEETKFKTVLSEKSVLLSGKFPEQSQITVFIENKNIGKRVLLDSTLQTNIELGEEELAKLNSGQELEIFAEYVSGDLIYRIGTKIKK